MGKVLVAMSRKHMFWVMKAFGDYQDGDNVKERVSSFSSCMYEWMYAMMKGTG
jgi:hypothetical protein